MQAIRKTCWRGITAWLCVMGLWGCGGSDSHDGAIENPSQEPTEKKDDDVVVEIAQGGSDIGDGELPLYQGMLPEGLPADVWPVVIGPLRVLDGKSAEVAIVFPSDVRSAMFYVYGHEGSNVILNRVVGPAGVIVDDATPSGNVSQIAGAFPGQFYSKNRVIPSEGSGAWLIPNSPEVSFGPGTYQVSFGSYAIDMQTGAAAPMNRPLYVTLLVKRGTEVKTQGTLDLVLHFTGASNVTASTAPTNETLQGAIALMRRAYADVGVNINNIHYVDLNDASLRTIVLPEGTCSGGDLDRLLKHTADTAHKGLHLFFIDRFQCFLFGQFDMGQMIGGISGGIPGMALTKGTNHGGVAVSMAMMEQDPNTTAVVMAHESGHFLGLYHTQENTMMLGGAAIYDNIADTPDTRAGAEANLMNFSAGTAVTLTQGQGFVMRNNPLVQ